MNNEIAEKSYEIDLVVIAKALWRRIWAIILVACIFSVTLYVYAKISVKPKYSADVVLYVNNNSSVDFTSMSISGSDLNAAQSLVSTYLVILKSRTCLNKVIDETDLDYSYTSVANMITAAAVDETEIFKVTVTCGDAEEAKLIANTIAEVLPEKISDIVEGSSVRVVDYAVKNEARVSPSYSQYAAIGAFAGAALTALLVAILELVDELIHEESYLTNTYPDIPILAAIPDLTSRNRSYTYYTRDKKVVGYEASYNNVQADKEAFAGANDSKNGDAKDDASAVNATASANASATASAASQAMPTTRKAETKAEPKEEAKQVSGVEKELESLFGDDNITFKSRNKNKKLFGKKEDK